MYIIITIMAKSNFYKNKNLIKKSLIKLHILIVYKIPMHHGQ